MTFRAGIIRMACATLIAAAGFGFLACSALAQDTPAQPAPVGSAPKLPLWEAGLFGFGYTQPAYPGAEDRASRALGLAVCHLPR